MGPSTFRGADVVLACDVGKQSFVTVKHINLYVHVHQILYVAIPLASWLKNLILTDFF